MKAHEYFGLIAPVVAFLSVALAIATHPWFSFTENAISDLGAVGVEKNYILNAGLVVSGAFATIYAIGLALEQKSTLGRFGAVLFLIGCVSLSLVGAFPEWTPVHFPVSVTFFVFTLLGAFLVGISSESRKLATFTTTVIPTGIVLSVFALYSFKGVAIAEIVSSVVVSAWIYAEIFLGSSE